MTRTSADRVQQSAVNLQLLSDTCDLAAEHGLHDACTSYVAYVFGPQNAASVAQMCHDLFPVRRCVLPSRLHAESITYKQTHIKYVRPNGAKTTLKLSGSHFMVRLTSPGLAKGSTAASLQECELQAVPTYCHINACTMSSSSSAVHFCPPGSAHCQCR